MCENGERGLFCLPKLDFRLTEDSRQNLNFFNIFVLSLLLLIISYFLYKIVFISAKKNYQFQITGISS